MRWRDAYDLPERFRDNVPTPVTELLIAALCTTIAVGIRAITELFVSGVVPYALVFPSIAVATLLGGWRAGAITLVSCQFLAWYVIVPPTRFLVKGSLSDGVSLLFATLAQLVLLWSVSSFRNNSRMAAEIERSRAENLVLALRELDHRAKNNFQIAAGVLRLQARRSDNVLAAKQLREAADRIMLIAVTHSDLAVISSSINQLDLKPYLNEVCHRLVAQAPADIHVEIELDACEVDRDAALNLGLIANEIITNALKHAFSDGSGKLAVLGRKSVAHYELLISDDGPGFSEEAKENLGSQLIGMLAQRSSINITRMPAEGTTYRLHLPLENTENPIPRTPAPKGAADTADEKSFKLA